MAIKPKVACDALLTGYMEGGTRVVDRLAGRGALMAGDIATNTLRDLVQFRQKMEALPPVERTVLHSVKAARN